jgi:hypothetical protein
MPLRMIVRAEMRMADEIDAGQTRGEAATDGRPAKTVRTPDSHPVPIEDLGVSRQRLAEWRSVRDAGEAVMGLADASLQVPCCLTG